MASTASSSPSLIIDLVSKFLSKILEKDRNASTYLKQWESFKILLSTTPLDLNPIFSFITNITPTSPLMPKSPLRHESPVLARARFRPTEPIDTHMQSRGRSINLGSELETNHSYDGYESPSKRRGYSNRPRLSSNENLYSASPISVEMRKHQSNKPSNFAHGSILDSAEFATALTFGTPSKFESSFGTPIGADLGSGLLSPNLESFLNQSTKKPYPMTFLLNLSRQLKDHMEKHTDSLEAKHAGVKEAEAYGQFEARSPLRKVRMYEKKDQYPSPGLMDKFKLNYEFSNSPTKRKTDFYTRGLY